MQKIFKNKTRLIAVIFSIVGAVCLINEIYDFLTLPTTKEVDQMYGGLVDLIKYKESTYTNMLFWAIVLGAGLSYWINKKVFWILSLCIVSVVMYVSIFYFCQAVTFFSLPVLVLLLFIVFCALLIFIFVRLLMIKRVEAVSINRSDKIIGVILGFVLAILYCFLDMI